MPERYRSEHAGKETEEFVDDDLDTPEHEGSAGGNLERQVGARDEKKQNEKGVGKSRVTKENEAGEGNQGGLHGTGSDNGS